MDMDQFFENIDFDKVAVDTAKRVEQIDEKNQVELTGDENDCGDACKI